jgi:MFS family permease
LLSIFPQFYLALIFVGIWAISFAVGSPVYQSLINALIPSKQRATILSFNSLMESSGGVAFQPALGKAADVFGYATTYLMTSAVTFIALPFILFARLENTRADHIDNELKG